MSKSLHVDLYAKVGASWIFGRRSVGRVFREASTPSSGNAKRLSKSDTARLDRMTRGAPQVMVKVVSRTKTAVQLRRHVDYISREGALELESDYGPLQDKDEVAAVRESWMEHIESHDAVHSNRRAAVSVNLMLSMPAGTDRDAFKLAVRDFVESQFKGQHETLMAFHDDTEKPHAHIAVLSRDHKGKSLDANRDRLDQWRERFADHLNERGIEADASSRHARGVYVKGMHKHDVHRAQAGSLSKNMFAELRTVMDDHRAGRVPEPSPWKQASAAKNEAVRETLALAAIELMQSSDQKERDIGERVAAFAKGLREPSTRYDKLRRACAVRPDRIQQRLDDYERAHTVHENADQKRPKVRLDTDR